MLSTAFGGRAVTLVSLSFELKALKGETQNDETLCCHCSELYLQVDFSRLHRTQPLGKHHSTVSVYVCVRAHACMFTREFLRVCASCWCQREQAVIQAISSQQGCGIRMWHMSAWQLTAAAVCLLSDIQAERHRQTESWYRGQCRQINTDRKRLALLTHNLLPPLSLPS